MRRCHNRFAGFVLLLLLLPLIAQAQKIEYGAEATFYGSISDQLPFWFYTNKDGRVDGASSNLVNRFYGYYSHNDNNAVWQWSGGIDLSTRLSENNTVFLNQLYARLRYRGVTATAGRFYDPMGLNDRGLSMGSMLVSRNATPVPKVRIGTENFVSVPGTGDRLQFKAMLSHGWFEKDRYIESPYLHQKALYLKYQGERFFLTAGAAHNVTWGGTHPAQPDIGDEKPYKLPSSFSDFIDVLLGQASSSNNKNVPKNELTNVVGSSVAAYEVKAGVSFDQFSIKAYRQFFLDDKVSLAFRSPWDGLWGAGIELDDPDGFVTKLLWEHLNTKRQNAWEGTSLGRSDYYNNGVYRSGWTYEGNVIGTPLIINGPVGPFDGCPDKENTSCYPISNNIIVAQHFGIQGRPLEQLSYKILFTYSRNYGKNIDQKYEDGRVDQEGNRKFRPLSELRRDQYSTLLQFNYLIAPRYGLSLQSAVAFDIGELYEEERWGLQIGLQWKGMTDVF